MALKDRAYGQNIDLLQNELRNATVQVLASAPGSPKQGQIYFDSVLNTLREYNGSVWRNLDAGTLTDGSIANSALATNPLARANHTGTQTASTISDFDTQVHTSRLDQMAAPSADVSINSHKLTNVATPTGSTDAANKQYVDDTVAGLSWKDEVRVATTAAGTLATSFANGQTVDGVALVTGDRILVKNQATGSENGIYTVNASGAPTRATDSDTAAKIMGAAVYVSNGTTNGGSRFVLSNTGTITLGTTALTFVSFGGGSAYSAGNGLNLVGSTFNVVAGSGVIADGTSTRVDPSVVTRKYAAAFGDGSSTSFTINHALGTQDVIVQIYRNSGSFEQVEFDVQHTDANNVTINVSGLVPSSNQFRVVIHG